MHKHMLMLAAGLGLFAQSQAAATVLDTNFQQTVFAGVGSQTTGMAWAPDGSKRLFVSRKTGQIQIIKNGVVLPTPFATLSPIYLNSECGLIGICFDPNFIANGYVYVFVTVSSTQQQIIRYKAVGDVGTEKKILVAGLPTNGNNHDGGGIGVGPDGKLYWAIGDLGNGTGVDGNMTSLAAKVGRANLDGSVAVDNPFVDGPGGTNDYIWARGFRNPFTFTFQPYTGELWVNCVGTSYEQIFLVNATDHAGYNDYENNQPAGFITPKIKYRTNGQDTRNVAPATGAARVGGIVTFTTTGTHGFRQGEKITITNVVDGSFNGTIYVASVPSATTFTAVQAGLDATSGGGTATTLYQGGCVTGGCFYDSTAIPAAYQGNLFYGDLNSSLLMRATLSPLNEVMTVDLFANNVSQPIDMSVGPDGALYSVIYNGTIYRLAYTNHSSQKIIVTPTETRTMEGGGTAVTVCLATQPAGNVDINIARTSGSAGIDVYEGATLTFTPTNWSVPQPVRFQAIVDGDSTNSLAEFTVSSTGLASQTVMVHALDVAPQDSYVGPTMGEVGGRRVYWSGELGRTYVLEANDGLVPPWTPLVTNTFTGFSTNVLDTAATNAPARYYRARLLQ
jgi:glucose/arabinose dehydrogenase